MKPTARYLGGTLVILGLVAALLMVQGGVDTNPFTPEVVSPFPDGEWALTATESADMYGGKLINDSKMMRDREPELRHAWHDYDETGLPEPWQAALDWANAKSGGAPYFMARVGGKAVEFLLDPDPAKGMEQAKQAMEGLYDE